ncbi:thiamine pyrophosphate-binding protein [Natronorubrum texcoconense]|uniref:sulfopyruvate decarboxylase n=1 Tax=Natronorubrum texcoconense TaxID=1095776 RepID=A0A1G9D1N7_9EURY|nr:thiamine pyrophosphate-binding protein [Natronorubrum texcoconense]SDK57604.1 sulfopyruvate decarboxylase, alpha subunit [Natronorubrum texcoconense]
MTSSNRTDRWIPDAVEALKQADVEVVAHLPDSKIGPLIEAVESDSAFETVQVAREEAAIGVLTGAWVGGTRGALLCQSSGLANAINAIGSLTLPARTPFFAVVTRRGNLGEFNVAQVPVGYNIDRILDDFGVRNDTVTEADDVGHHIRLAAESAFSTATPYIILLEQTVTGSKLEGL